MSTLPTEHAAPATATPPAMAPSSSPSNAASSNTLVASTSTLSPPPASANVPTLQAPSQEPIAKTVGVPRSSAWFAMDKINPIEKRMLPEFFVHEELHRNFPPGAKLPSSKTPAIYMKYRNYMIQAYRQQPHVYLTATACRRNLAGDACAIMRVHEFLTHWGLINFDVPPHDMPPALHANYALTTSSTSDAVAVLTPSKTSPPRARNSTTEPNTTPSSTTWVACDACGANPVTFELTSEAKRKTGKELSVNGFGLRPGSGVCDDCFLQRSFPETVDAADFVRVPTVVRWSKDEDERLLEAVSASTRMSQDACDWTQIAGKVQTKSAEECIVRFLELPILSRSEDYALSSSLTEQRPTFEYAEALNASVLDMASLVRDVDPFVAKAAARAAIQAVKDLHKLPPTETLKTEPTTDAKTSEENGQASTTVEDAAAAVASSAEAAGLASIKQEPTTTTTTTTATTDGSGDVEMASADEAPITLTKEVVAVAHEASSATAAALLATRATAIATETAEGPIRGLVTQLLQTQLEQMELKMQQISVLEKALATEKEALTKERHQLYMDRLAFAQQKLGQTS
ncbi:hypothetical protein Poli38472_007228 [Pythium oligandrum]|uniref:SWIRM-domain-containing protein n=1 Tax=Pythium oligandrum TaxID=41045 RepID=A0A8K1FHT4_PYTOL|nr:hypothetical protein Poli38472_007228 [Pythium oligandrum]|eukprot:TMW59083.1 hypothetical protein Poli38472_007228 [Pythium oligandrum]